MSEVMAQDTGIREEAAPDAGIDEGTYEVLRRRLAGHAAELAERAGALDARRLEVFGGTELRLLGTERIRTADACVPGDILPVGGYLLFGHNPVTGAKPETGIEDVLSLHRLTRGDGTGSPWSRPVPARSPASWTTRGSDAISPSCTGTTGRPGS